MPGFPVFHYLLELAQTHIKCVSDAIQPSHPLSPHFPPALDLSQHKESFPMSTSLHHVAKLFELQHQSFHEYSLWCSQLENQSS